MWVMLDEKDKDNWRATICVNKPVKVDGVFRPVDGLWSGIPRKWFPNLKVGEVRLVGNVNGIEQAADAVS